ncbi:alpha/beta hydrolase [Streptomyces sp. TR02-1]|uniref:alpha/beta hydrolase n=1 Tax=Streptomyces sp. TR02-1 TaxID=3385977 RepID=UPI0039A1BD96
MRKPTKAAVAASTALGVTVAAAAAGRLAAGRALRPGISRHPRGEGPVPAGFEERMTVHARSAVQPPQVALTRCLTADLPGTYGLVGRDVHAVVGHVLHDATHTAPADSVVRQLRRVTRGDPTTGADVRLTPMLHEGDPRTALGLECDDIEIPGELGPLPAWYVPGDRQTWVITAHGLGAGRGLALNILPHLHHLGTPVLVPARRGDRDAPDRPDGTGPLGAGERRDLEAAVRHALERGASRVLLHGWSSGATAALHVAAESALRGSVAGLVLDSPVLDPEATLRALAGSRGIPRSLLPLAVRAVEGRAARRPERPAVCADPDLLNVPVLLVHGPDDTVAPWRASCDLADARPDLVTLHTVPRAQHAAMWNAHPRGYEELLSRFLTPLL